MKALLLLLLVAAEPAPECFAERCDGRESVRVGELPPRTLAYTLTFSADLAHRLYCYDRCLSSRTYFIAAITADRVTLADVDASSTRRRMVYDRASATLHDEQSFGGGPMRIARAAVARCRPARYRQPPFTTP